MPGTSLQAKTKVKKVGRVVTPVVIENLADQIRANDGLLKPDQIRRLEVADALVDTDASFLSLPTRLIRQLGLEFHYKRRGVTPGGSRTGKVYSSVRLYIQDRDCVIDVAEVSDKAPVLVGQIPLEIMDLVVDPRHGKLIPNPAHGGEWTIELF